MVLKVTRLLAVGAVEREGDVVLASYSNTLIVRPFTSLFTPLPHWIPKLSIPMIGLPTMELRMQDTKHETVNHSADEWVRGDVHTNSVENIWSLLKRSIVGSYHQVSKKHLDSYLDELEWRFNGRENPYLFRDTLLKLIKSENLPYSELVSGK